MSVKHKCLMLFIATVIIVAHPLYALEAKGKFPVVVNGDEVEYFQDEQKVVGTGKVEVTYEDIRLTCDKITVYLDTKDAVMEGNVKLYHEDYVYFGEKATYNFETKKGEVINAGIDASPWIGRGEVIRKTGAKEYHIEKGYITSCDHDPPHYKIQSKEVKIFLDDKIVANNSLMYIGKFPVLYIPFYVHPLFEKKSMVTVVPGYDKEWGGFALTKWRYHLNDYIKGYVHADYREKKDLAWGVDTKYDTKLLGDGLLQTYYMNERTLHAKRIWDEHDPPTEERERFKVQLRHKWKIDSDTDVKAEYHKFSDSTVLKDYFYRDYEDDELPATYVTALRQRPLYSAEFRVDKRANRYETVTERLPEFELDIGKNKFLDTNFYYISENSVSNLDKKFGNDAQKDIDVFRADTYNEISYLMDIFGLLSVSPYAATRQTYFTKDSWGEPDWIRGIFYTGVDASARFYKTSDFETDLFGLDINGLRHIVNPVVKYYYNHDPTILPRNLMQFDDIDNLDRQNGVRLELTNKLQTKRELDGKMTTVDFARLLVATDYLFKIEQGSGFTDLEGELELRPYQWLYMEAEARYDHEKSKIEKAGWDLVAQDPTSDERWSFSVGQRYELGHASQLATDFSYKVNSKWQIRAYERFKLNEKVLQEQEYAIVRDLHCWDMEFLYNTYKGEGGTFWVIFRLKALPGVPLKASTSYSKPRTETQRF